MSRTAGVDRRALVWAALAILLIAVVVGWFVLPIRGWIESLDAWIRDLGPWGIVLFVVAYILLVVALAPAEVMTIFAGLASGSGHSRSWLSRQRLGRRLHSCSPVIFFGRG